MYRKLKDIFVSLIKFLYSSKRMVLLVIITVLVTLVISTLISIWLSKITSLNVPSLANIKTLGVEAYWDKNLENKTETINWGTIWLGASKNFTLYLQSTSNTETTLLLNATNWNPANISKHVNLSWNYNKTILQPGETIQVILTLTASSSSNFLRYLLNNEVKEFSFDIIISTSEHID